MSAADPSQLGKLDGRCEPAGVKLVERGQLLRRESLILRSEGGERRLQPLGQAGRAIVVAHAIKNIGHAAFLQSFESSPQRYDGFRRATIRDNIDRL